MKTYWVIVRVWRGLADRVWLYDDGDTGQKEYEDMKEKETEDEDISIIEVEL